MDPSATDTAAAAAAARAVWRRLHAPTVDALRMILESPGPHAAAPRARWQRRQRGHHSPSNCGQRLAMATSLAAAASTNQVPKLRQSWRLLSEVPAVDAALGREALAVLQL